VTVCNGRNIRRWPGATPNDSQQRASLQHGLVCEVTKEECRNFWIVGKEIEQSRAWAPVVKGDF